MIFQTYRATLCAVVVVLAMTAPSQLVSEKVTATALAYHRQVESMPPTALELATWFDKLPTSTKLQIQKVGLEACLLLPNFRRYVLEKRGYFMTVYMALHLTPEELTHWVDDGEAGM